MMDTCAVDIDIVRFVSLLEEQSAIELQNTLYQNAALNLKNNAMRKNLRPTKCVITIFFFPISLAAHTHTYPLIHIHTINYSICDNGQCEMINNNN